MTVKQKKLVNALPKMVANGGNLSQVAREAGYSESMARNTQKIKAMPAVQDALQALLKSKGITLDKALQPIADGLTAQTVVIIGKGEDAFADLQPNHQVRLASSDRALKLLNITSDKPQTGNMKELTEAINNNVDEVALTRAVFKTNKVVDPLLNDKSRVAK